MDIWTEKYRPRDLNHYIGHVRQITAIEDWFDRFRNGEIGPREKGLLLSGPPGLGKTTIAHIVLRKYGYLVREYNASDIRSRKQVDHHFTRIFGQKNIYSVVQGNANAKTGIIMDEVDGMSSGERGGTGQLIEFISPTVKKGKSRNKITPSKPRIPVICICNETNKSKGNTNDLRKICLEVAFKHPSEEDLENLMQYVEQHENFTIESGKTRSLIIHMAQGDFRRMINILEYVYHKYATGNKNGIKCIKHDLGREELEQTWAMKEQDLHIKESIRKLLTSKLDYSDIRRLYENDKSQTPMMIHEYYYQFIDYYKNATFRRKLNAMAGVMEALVLSDLIEKHMYNSQRWNLQPVHGLVSSLASNYYINLYPKIRHAQIVPINWTTALGKFSYQRNNMKNMEELIFRINNPNNYDITDIQTLSYIILELFNRNCLEIGLRLLKLYNLEIDDLKKLVRTIKVGGHDYTTMLNSKPFQRKLKTTASELDGYLDKNKSTINDFISEIEDTRIILDVTPQTMTIENIPEQFNTLDLTSNLADKIADDIIKIISKENELTSMMSKLREKLYTMLVQCLQPSEILDSLYQMILNILYRKMDKADNIKTYNTLNKHIDSLIDRTCQTQLDLNMNCKAIYHLENYLIYLIDIFR